MAKMPEITVHLADLDEVKAALAAADAEIERLREALTSVATERGGDWDHPDYDWRLLALKKENIARHALGSPPWVPHRRL